jgi:hypothetical protein
MKHFGDITKIDGHEDVRGDDMIEVGYAEQFLQDLLCEFGCWDEENK